MDEYIHLSLRHIWQSKHWNNSYLAALQHPQSQSSNSLANIYHHQLVLYQPNQPTVRPLQKQRGFSVPNLGAFGLEFHTDLLTPPILNVTEKFISNLSQSINFIFPLCYWFCLNEASASSLCLYLIWSPIIRQTNQQQKRMPNNYKLLLSFLF